MKSKLILRTDLRDAAFDTSLLDCRPDEKTVSEKLGQLAKKHTQYIGGERVEKGAILRLKLDGTHPRCKNDTVEIAQGYHMFNAALEDALDGAKVGSSVTVATEQGTITATVLSIAIPKVAELTDELIRAEGIADVATVDAYRRHISQQLAEKTRDRNRILVCAQRSEDLIRHAEVLYDEDERRAWLDTQLVVEKEQMQKRIPEAEFDSVWSMNAENLTAWIRGRFDQMLLAIALQPFGTLPDDATEAECREFVKKLLLKDVDFILE